MTSLKARLAAIERHHGPRRIVSMQAWTISEYECYQATGQAPANVEGRDTSGWEPPFVIVYLDAAHQPVTFIKLVYEEWPLNEV